MEKILIIIALLISFISFSQEKTEKELKTEKRRKNKERSKLKKEIASIDKKLEKFNFGWKFNMKGTVGGSFAGFNNWFSNPIRNSSTANVNILIKTNANLKKEKYFWKNTTTVNLAWNKIENKDQDYSVNQKDKHFKRISDLFNLSSLFGYNLSKKIALSSFAEYRSSVIENFNNPGYLDVGIGSTWTPVKQLVIVIHPLNFNYVFSDSKSTFESSLGSKFVIDFKKKFGRLKYTSNLSTFISYVKNDYSNWYWVNSLGLNIWKGLGLSFENGLKQNKQEAYNSLKSENPNWNGLSDAANPLQTYWLVGLSYLFK